ncbi:hypothetical protein ALC57_02867, partial [Trachymyrmex cornetzi]
CARMSMINYPGSVMAFKHSEEHGEGGERAHVNERPNRPGTPGSPHGGCVRRNFSSTTTKLVAETTREKTRVMPFIGSCKWHNTLFRSRDRVIRIPERAYRVLILIRPQRGILIRMLFGINGGGGDTLSTAKYTNPKIQAEHRAVKRSPARVMKTDLETY